ncbi:MAG: bi-domain-containing oxidoreductase [Planctomycetota bacterium]
MKQILQSYKDGEVQLAEVPPPVVPPGGVLVRTRASAISPGTELQMIRMGEKSLLGKAKARPDLVRRVLQKVRTEGLLSTWRQVKARIEAPVPMGYSCSGEVIEVGSGVTDLTAGQRVACAGVGYASHGEINAVPRNLVFPIPAEVGFEEAAFVALGSIAMQGVRQAQVAIGEVVAVIGLGLLGQLTAQLLAAQGAKVVATDLDEWKRDQARAYGAAGVAPEDFVKTVRSVTSGHGADAVIVTASSESNEIMMTSAEAARCRGRVVVVGFVGMDFAQKPFYEKELDIRFSMSYGPGRYDVEYEERSRDYPYSLVRWTEGRNMQAVLEMMRSGALKLTPLITHRFEIDGALDAYAMLKRGGERYLGVAICYRPASRKPTDEKRIRTRQTRASGDVRLGVMGAGAYAGSTLLPTVRACRGVSLVGVATRTGKSAAHAAEKFGFAYATCDWRELLRDDCINAVVVATRHDLHALQVIEAIQAGKHVLVEKPLALSEQELDEIESVAAEHPETLLLVGHNRRFSPAADRLREVFAERRSPMTVAFRVNAGPMPPDHWHRSEQGGGRWLAEGSHFVDFAVAMTGLPPQRVSAFRTTPGGDAETGETWMVTLTFADGSLAEVHYCDLGDRRLPKERCEVMADGHSAVVDDFSKVVLYSGGRKRVIRTGHDKGHRAEVSAFAKAVQNGGAPLVTLEEQLAVARATIRCHASWTLGQAVNVSGPLAGPVESGN